MHTILCSHCGAGFSCSTRYINRAAKSGAPLFCSKACFGLSRRVTPKDTEQAKAEKAAYDIAYRARNVEKRKAEKAAYYQRTKDPEKERAIRQANMPRHVEYCRQPEYKAKKHEYDIKKACAEFGEFAETWRLLLELEKEIRSQASAYERRVANGYYTRNAQKRRRELCLIRKASMQAI